MFNISIVRVYRRVRDAFFVLKEFEILATISGFPVGATLVLTTVWDITG